MSVYSILLVDDDLDVLRAVGGYFEKLGHTVTRATNGEEALGLYEQVRPHVTILDYQMPGLSGLEVLERLRRNHAIVLMLTGNGKIDTAVEAMRLGAENFLQKPVDMDHLLQAVEKAAEKAILRTEIVQLRARLPNRRKRMRQSLAVLVMLAAAVLLGLAIGQEGRPDPPSVPVPLEEGR